MRILYVEDDALMADATTYNLKKSGIAVDWAKDGEEGLNLAVKPIYDAIVLDVMLPKMSGFDILKTIRDRNIKTPVIMLTALTQVEDKIRGLNIGADDYLEKPFKSPELIARLNALTRRPPLQETKEIHFEDLNFNVVNRTLNDIPLTEKEADILEMLIKNPGTIQQKEHILAKVWGSENISDENYVEVYISNLRKKLKSLRSKAAIKTIRNLGYKLITK
ncbi:response regulator transcription factor [Candidatus Saccharibacteria bacterium]|nr:response regulator transcription factor [Candidatus Saccharibacteria bacterium]MBR3323456.1 response regulator transcription factor [Candidatus Saccharibacteria bacterium]